MDKYRVVYIQGQGYGWLIPEDWAEIPPLYRERVHILAAFDTEREARDAYHRLPQEWGDKSSLHYTGGEWWQSTDEVVTGQTGQPVELFVPADRPVPVIRVTQEQLETVRIKLPEVITATE
jgi:hypothetical protein